MVRAVLFDLGETLLHFGSADIHDCFREGARLAFEHLRSQGKPIADFEQFQRRCQRAIRWAYFRSRLRRREIRVEPLLRKQLAKLGVQIDLATAQALAALFYEPLRRTARPEAEAHETLQRLRDESIRLGIVSNTFVPGVALDAHLESERLLTFFPVRVYSCDVGYRKPDRRIFQIALERLGVRPEQAMFVGDTLRADVRGANRVGMISVWKHPDGAAGTRNTGGWIGRCWLGALRPDHVIRRLSELPELVRRYRKPSA